MAAKGPPGEDKSKNAGTSNIADVFKLFGVKKPETEEEKKAREAREAEQKIIDDKKIADDAKKKAAEAEERAAILAKEKELLNQVKEVNFENITLKETQKSLVIKDKRLSISQQAIEADIAKNRDLIDSIKERIAEKENALDAGVLLPKQKPGSDHLSAIHTGVKLKKVKSIDLDADKGDQPDSSPGDMLADLKSSLEKRRNVVKDVDKADKAGISVSKPGAAPLKPSDTGPVKTNEQIYTEEIQQLKQSNAESVTKIKGLLSEISKKEGVAEARKDYLTEQSLLIEQLKKVEEEVNARYNKLAQVLEAAEAAKVPIAAAAPSDTGATESVDAPNIPDAPAAPPFDAPPLASSVSTSEIPVAPIPDAPGPPAASVIPDAPGPPSDTQGVPDAPGPPADAPAAPAAPSLPIGGGYYGKKKTSAKAAKPPSPKKKPGGLADIIEGMSAGADKEKDSPQPPVIPISPPSKERTDHMAAIRAAAEVKLKVAEQKQKELAKEVDLDAIADILQTKSFNLLLPSINASNAPLATKIQDYIFKFNPDDWDDTPKSFIKNLTPAEKDVLVNVYREAEHRKKEQAILDKKAERERRAAKEAENKRREEDDKKQKAEAKKQAQQAILEKLLGNDIVQQLEVAKPLPDASQQVKLQALKAENQAEIQAQNAKVAKLDGLLDKALEKAELKAAAERAKAEETLAAPVAAAPASAPAPAIPIAEAGGVAPLVENPKPQPKANLNRAMVIPYREKPQERRDNIVPPLVKDKNVEKPKADNVTSGFEKYFRPFRNGGFEITLKGVNDFEKELDKLSNSKVRESPNLNCNVNTLALALAVKEEIQWFKRNIDNFKNYSNVVEASQAEMLRLEAERESAKTSQERDDIQYQIDVLQINLTEAINIRNDARRDIEGSIKFFARLEDFYNVVNDNESREVQERYFDSVYGSMQPGTTNIYAQVYKEEGLDLSSMNGVNMQSITNAMLDLYRTSNQKVQELLLKCINEPTGSNFNKLSLFAHPDKFPGKEEFYKKLFQYIAPFKMACSEIPEYRQFILNEVEKIKQENKPAKETAEISVAQAASEPQPKPGDVKPIANQPSALPSAPVPAAATAVATPVSPDVAREAPAFPEPVEISPKELAGLIASGTLVPKSSPKVEKSKRNEFIEYLQKEFSATLTQNNHDRFISILNAFEAYMPGIMTEFCNTVSKQKLGDHDVFGEVLGPPLLFMSVKMLGLPDDPPSQYRPEHKKLAAVLLEHTDPNLKIGNTTLLNNAIRSRNPAVVEMLVTHRNKEGAYIGSDITSAANDGNTPQSLVKYSTSARGVAIKKILFKAANIAKPLPETNPEDVKPIAGQPSAPAAAAPVVDTRAAAPIAATAREPAREPTAASVIPEPATKPAVQPVTPQATTVVDAANDKGPGSSPAADELAKKPIATGKGARTPEAIVASCNKIKQDLEKTENILSALDFCKDKGNSLIIENGLEKLKVKWKNSYGTTYEALLARRKNQLSQILTSKGGSLIKDKRKDDTVEIEVKPDAILNATSQISLDVMNMIKEIHSAANRPEASQEDKRLYFNLVHHLVETKILSKDFFTKHNLLLTEPETEKVNTTPATTTTPAREVKADAEHEAATGVDRKRGADTRSEAEREQAAAAANAETREPTKAATTVIHEPVRAATAPEAPKPVGGGATAESPKSKAAATIPKTPNPPDAAANTEEQPVPLSHAKRPLIKKDKRSLPTRKAFAGISGAPSKLAISTAPDTSHTASAPSKPAQPTDKPAAASPQQAAPKPANVLDVPIALHGQGSKAPAPAPAESLQQPPVPVPAKPVDNAARLSALQAQPNLSQLRGNTGSQMTSGFNAQRESAPLPGGVAAVASHSKITSAALAASFTNIQNNTNPANPNRDDLFKRTNATLEPGAKAENFTMKMKYDGKEDTITRKAEAGPDNTMKMRVTLSRNASDDSFRLFFQINKDLDPLNMKQPCNNAEITLKILEASVQMKMKIELNESDKALFNLPENQKYKELYDYLQNPDNHQNYRELIAANPDRKLGDSSLLQPKAEARAGAEEDIELQPTTPHKSSPQG